MGLSGSKTKQYSEPPVENIGKFTSHDEVAHAMQLQMEMEVEGEASAADNRCHWRGLSLEEISVGCGSPELPPVAPSQNHTVLYRLPWVAGSPPQAHPRNPRNAQDAWDSDHVRLPCSPLSLYAVTNCEGKNVLRERWELVREALEKPIKSSFELQEAILSYNTKYTKRWDFTCLHFFFSEVMEEEENAFFFSNVLPHVVLLALELPSLVKTPIPLLRQHRARSVSLSQLQVASLLANAFLCTFPRRNTAQKNSEYANFPDINFNRLFGQGWRSSSRNIEKLKCIFTYFRRLCDKAPDGVITFTRRHIEPRAIPRWDRSEECLPRLHVTSQGTIEDQGGGMLQVDFANSFVGGGVLGTGCVQEEIRFLVCPELIISRLFTEELGPTEALLITGCERFSTQRGYADSFRWSGSYVDETPRDSSGRRRCALVAIDALYLRNPDSQFTPKCVLRELNKAFVGFHNPDVPANERLSPVATGNWGCGAFRGKATLKSLIQFMAAARAGRDVAYFTFHDNALRDQIYDMHAFLVEQGVTVGRLWRLLCQYYEFSYRNGQLTKELYPYLYHAVLSKERVAVQTTLGFQRALHTNSPSSSQETQNHKDTSRERKPQQAESSHTEPKSGTLLNAEDLTKALEALPEFPDETVSEERSPQPKTSPGKSRLLDALDFIDEQTSSPGSNPRSQSKFLEAYERRQRNSDPAPRREGRRSDDPGLGPAPVGLDPPADTKIDMEDRERPEQKPKRPAKETRGNSETRPHRGPAKSGTSTPQTRISDYFSSVPKKND